MNNRSAEWTAARWYGLALVSVAAALGLRLGLIPVAGFKWPFLLFALAVVVTARFGGLLPGLVATAGSLAAVWYLLIEPRYSFAIDDPADVAGLAVFAIVGASISLLSGKQTETGERLAARLPSSIVESSGDGILSKTLAGTVLIAWDITGQKQSQEASLVSATSQMVGSTSAAGENRSAEEEVRRLNAELEAFAYSVSHDLRAPLRAIDGFSRIVLEEYAAQLPEGARHYLEIARRNALQMGELIDGLLAFSRLGRQPVCKQRLAPSDLVRQAWEDISVDWQGRTVEMVVGDLPPCEADPLLLQQIFVNLLSNALKFTRTRAVARIEIASPPAEEWDALPPQLTADKTALVYMVRDNGVGFDMRYAEKLFGVFQRLHRAEEYAGAGIGLANVKRLVHKHGGEVWASGELDRGATFYFTLPGIRAPEERPAARQQEQLQS